MGPKNLIQVQFFIAISKRLPELMRYCDYKHFFHNQSKHYPMPALPDDNYLGIVVYVFLLLLVLI